MLHPMREEKPRQSKLTAADWLDVDPLPGSLRHLLLNRNITVARACKLAGGLTPRTMYDFLKQGSELRWLYVLRLLDAFPAELTYAGLALEARATDVVRKSLQAPKAID